jgi:hypothetical protein
MKYGSLAVVPFLPGEFMKDLPAVRGTPLKKLAEAIILQALEDLWSTRHKYESVSFFREEGFRRYARIAGMDHSDILRFFGLINRVRTGDHNQERVSLKLQDLYRQVGE